MNILVDAMGGDHAPLEIVNGCLDALNEGTDYDITLIGNIEKINSILEKRQYDNSRIKLINATEVITNDDTPTKAIKSKKDSSMVIGLKMLKDKKGDVFISAGNTGAVMTGSLLILGRIRGVDRPALVSPLPARNGVVLLLDSGANTTCKPINYKQFGIMGSIYMRDIFGVKNPKVGLINVGSEDKKGNEIIKQAFIELSNSNINFVGNVEGREIVNGEKHVDVAVCDGFVGNVLLKFLEGLGSFIMDSIKEVFTENIFSKVSALVVKNGLKKFKKRLDYVEYGGVPLLGVNGKVIKCHGSSNARAIKNAVIKANSFAASTILEEFKEQFKIMGVEKIEK